MATISGYDSNSISTLFSGINNNARGNSSVFFGNSGSMNMGVDLGTYGLIKSGSYFKLMQSYYATDEGKEALKQAVSGNTSTSKDSAKTLAEVKSDSEALMKSAAELYKANSDVFKKVDTKDLEGKTNTDYNRDAIYKAVNQFVNDYNAAITSAEKSNTSSIANAAASMVNNTQLNEKYLQKLGITMSDKDYTLSIDKDIFDKADVSAIKSVFNGAGSFAYSVASKASMISSHAALEASKSNTYNNNGGYTYNYNTGELYNSKW